MSTSKEKYILLIFINKVGENETNVEFDIWGMLF